MHRQAFKWALLFLLFPTFFWRSYVSLLFSENALLFLLFSPNMFGVIKNCIFISSLARSCKSQIYLILAATMQVYKIFYFSWNSFFGTFILAFPFHGNVALLFRESFVCFLYLFFQVWKHSVQPYYSYVSCLKFLFLPYFFKFLCPTLSLLFQWRIIESLHRLIWVLGIAQVLL